MAAWPNGSQRRFRYSQNCKVDGSSRRSQRWGGQRGHGFSLKFKLQIIIIKIKVLTFSALGVLIVLDFEQTTCVMCLCWWGKGEGGVPLRILIPLNFINIAERRSFFATLQASDVQ